MAFYISTDGGDPERIEDRAEAHQRAAALFAQANGRAEPDEGDESRGRFIVNRAVEKHSGECELPLVKGKADRTITVSIYRQGE